MEKALSRDIHKVIKVIESCVTYEQLVSAHNMYCLLKKRWGYHKNVTYWNHIENVYLHQKKQILNED